MTQTQLVQILADRCAITKKAAKHLLDTLADTAIAEVKEKGLFVVPGIGRLVRVDSEAPVKPPDGSKIRISEIEVPPPKIALRVSKEDKALRTVGKTDWSIRDAANRDLGMSGEKFVFELERHRLKGIGRADLATKVEWSATVRGDGLGYDIRSFDDNGRQKFIEVKTTNHAKSVAFLITARELECGREFKGRYWIYRLFNFGAAVGLYRISGPLEGRLELRPKVYTATVR